MDSINNLRDLLKCGDDKVDVLRLRSAQREFKSELKLRRIQVEQLTAKLDESNRQNHDLKRSLEKSETLKKELQLNLGLLRQKVNSLETQNKEISDALMNAKLKQEIGASEAETLKEYAHKMAMEKYEFEKQVQEMESLQKYNAAFQNEAMEKDAQIGKTVNDIKDFVEKLQEEHKKVLQLGKLAEDFKEKLSVSNYYENQIETLRSEKNELEVKLIKLNARATKLEEVIAVNPAIIEPDFITKTVFEQWQASSSFLNKRVDDLQEIVKVLTEKLKASEEACCRIAMENQELEKKLDELQQDGDVKVMNDAFTQVD